jgi:hypothetical protein
VFPTKLVIVSALIVGGTGLPAQQPPAQTPPVKVNVLNVCSPSADDQKELSAALAKVPAKPTFAKDFEVARGHSTLDPNAPVPGMQALPPGESSSADWVRVRREFPDSGLFSNVQYSFSVDSSNMVEILVLRVRDPKDLMQISIEDSASAVTSASAMLSTDTPVARIKLERFGKSSIALASCPAADGSNAANQSAYEPIFHAASAILVHYRDALGVRKTVPQELARLGVGGAKKSPARAKKSP